MKKLIQLLLLIVWVIFWSFSQIAEARTGKTSSSSSSSSSRSSSSSSRSSSSSYSRSSSSSSSRPSSSSSSSFFSRSKTDSAFSSTAKTNQARSAWQERNKPTTITPPPLPNTSTRSIPTYTPSYERNAGATTDIEKQLSDIKTEQRLIGLGQVFSQWLFSNNRHTSNSNNRVVTPPVNSPATVNNPINNTLPNTVNSTPIAVTPSVPVVAPSVPAVPETSKEQDDEGMSWFTILIIIGGTVWLIMWFKKRATPTTIYRL